MKIGILGGTFDPIHLGHLILAEQCREQCRLEQIWFIPAARPPHKLDRVTTPYHHRAEMIRLAIAGQPAFRLEEIEKDRPGPSYTVDTLSELALRHPEAEFFLILGSDCLPELPGWHESQRLPTLATFLVVERPGFPADTAHSLGGDLGLSEPIRLKTVRCPLISIAGSDVRQRVAEGRTIRYLVPRSVECYLENHRLYRT